MFCTVLRKRLFIQGGFAWKNKRVLPAVTRFVFLLSAWAAYYYNSPSLSSKKKTD